MRIHGDADDDTDDHLAMPKVITMPMMLIPMRLPLLLLTAMPMPLPTMLQMMPILLMTMPMMLLLMVPMMLMVPGNDANANADDLLVPDK